MTRILAAAIAVLLLNPADPVAAADGAVHAALRQALSCGTSPLDTVRDLADAGSTRLAEGFTGWHYGEEMDAVAGVVVHAPLRLAGAQASTVIATLATAYEDFDAHVHAEFSGDFRPVVTELNLRRDRASGNYLRAMPAAGPDDICPMTIALRPLGDGRFLLGCGWCNG